MSFVLVLISGSEEIPLDFSHLERIERTLKAAGHPFSAEYRWLAPHRAAETTLPDSFPHSVMRALWDVLSPYKIDALVAPAANRRKKLLLADMDATITQGETLDDLAAYVGLKDKISAITARAMRGELDFKEALEERVCLLQGLPETALQETLNQTRLSPGAEQLVRTMRQNGAACILVSGGFTFFTKAIAEKTGFSAHHGNALALENGKLTGKIIPPILDKNAKRDFLISYRLGLNLSPEDTLAVGDGANDLPMLQEAEIGIGYRPKPLLQEHLSNCLYHADLTALLYLQGYTWQEINEALH
jgi:phosphoserine phosphatase